MARRRLSPALAGLVLALAATSPSLGKSRESAQLSDATVTEIRRAMTEDRLIDAGQMIDQAMLTGSKDARLKLLAGELGLARKRFDMALADFKAAEASPPTRAEALQGQGLALISLGRINEARGILERAVEAAPNSWRAWNALGTLFDHQRDWPKADAAYARALETSGNAPIVLNNRGYSRLLQARYDEAAADLVAALNAKPDLDVARTNLRLALAMQGEYTRSLAGGGDEATLLNNAGFAAGMRGDYARAEDYLNRALKARGQYFERAAENLKLIRSVAARTSPDDHAAR